jgi:peptidyl-prolyl cis-trans isomerase C
MKRTLPAALAILACSNSPGESPSSSPTPSAATLPPGIVADVGPLAIRLETVAAVASARRITSRDALEREIRDAVFANGALHQGLEQNPLARAALRGALARATLEALKQEAARTEPTDAEVDEGTQRHFVDLDRPEAFRVIHAVVRVAENAAPALKSRARSLAERIADAVSKSNDEAAFRSAAESVDHGDLEVVVQTLAPVAADGRVVDPDHPADHLTFALSFSQAASRLTHPGQKSGVVATEFGFHTMMLLERTPAHSVPLDERRRILRDEIFQHRAHKLRDELLTRVKSTLASNVERSADALLSTVDVAAHETP